MGRPSSEPGDDRDRPRSVPYGIGGGVVSEGGVVTDGGVVSDGGVVTDGGVVSDGGVVTDGGVVSVGGGAGESVGSGVAVGTGGTGGRGVWPVPCVVSGAAVDGLAPSTGHTGALSTRAPRGSTGS